MFSFLDFESDSSENAYDVIASDNGKTITIGFILHSNNYDVLVSRLNSNGSPDLTFGNKGYACIDLDNGSFERAFSGLELYDGKLVIVGYTLNNGNTDGFILRLNSDGSLDKSFGAGSKGYTIFNSGDDKSCRPDKIIKYGGSFYVAANTVVNGNAEYSVYKFTGGGGVDQSFGTDGVIHKAVYASDNITSMAISSEGKIALGGFSFNNGTRFGVVMQFKNTGSIDKSFNTTGVRILDFGTDMNTVSDLIYDQNDQLVAVGFEGENPDNDGVIMRFTAKGAFDNTFGTDGKVFSDIGTTTSVITNNVDILEDNSILASGYLYQNGNSQVYALVLTETGKPHSKFGTGGDVNYSMPIEVGNMSIRQTVVQEDGDILMIGSKTAEGSGENEMFAVRLVGPDFSSTASLYTAQHQIITLYPNPASFSFSFEVNNTTIESVTMTDMQGRVVQTFSKWQSTYQIADDISTGNYIIHAISKDGLYSGRLAVQR